MLPRVEQDKDLPVRMLIVDMRGAGREVVRFYLVNLRREIERNNAVEEQSRLIRAYPSIPINQRCQELDLFFSVNSAPFRFVLSPFLNIVVL